MSGISIVGASVVGVLAGLVAEQVMARHNRLLTNLILGVVGAFLGGFLADAFDIHGILGNLAFASIGAAVLIACVWRFAGWIPGRFHGRRWKPLR